MMKILMVMVVAGCGANELQSDIPGERSDSEILDKAIDDGGKADSFGACGGSSCEARLCGFQTPAGQVPAEACFPNDSRRDAYVKFSVSGSESLSIDSRSLGYRPVLAFDHVVFYGTELWQFSPQRNGLGVEYRDIIDGAFLVGDPYTYGPELDLYLPDFKGPGSYSVQAGFSTARSYDRKTTTGKRYTTPACQMTVSAGSPDGITGRFNCTLTAREGGSVSLSGEFQAGATALDGPIIVAH